MREQFCESLHLWKTHHVCCGWMDKNAPFCTASLLATLREELQLSAMPDTGLAHLWCFLPLIAPLSCSLLPHRFRSLWLDFLNLLRSTQPWFLPFTFSFLAHSSLQVPSNFCALPLFFFWLIRHPSLRSSLLPSHYILIFALLASQCAASRLHIFL